MIRKSPYLKDLDTFDPHGVIKGFLEISHVEPFIVGKSLFLITKSKEKLKLIERLVRTPFDSQTR